MGLRIMVIVFMKRTMNVTRRRRKARKARRRGTIMMKTCLSFTPSLRPWRLIRSLKHSKCTLFINELNSAAAPVVESKTIDPAIHQQFKSELKSHVPIANEVRADQGTYSFGAQEPADVSPYRERLKAPVTDKEGNIYDGEVRSGTMIREGRGVLIKKDGAFYEGWFRNNKFHGRGRVISAQGDMYEGELRDGRETGIGTFKWVDGSCYVGAMKDGQRNGQGEYEWPDGERYVGDFVNSKRDGKGIFY